MVVDTNPDSRYRRKTGGMRRGVKRVMALSTERQIVMTESLASIDC